MSDRRPNWPIDPRRWPFFYGWVIVVVGALGVLASMPGQTVGVGVFTGPLCEALGVSRLQLSIAYLIGTGLSGFFLGYGGKLYDRWGARRTFVLSVVGLGLVWLGFAGLGELAGWLREAGVLVALAVVTLAFLAIRFTGQGMTTMVSRSMIAKWFDKRRGLAIAFSGTGATFGLSAAPKTFQSLIDQVGWQGAYVLIGLVLIGVFGLMGWLFFRDNPEECGLQVDGGWQPRRVQKENLDRVIHRDFTGPEARRTYSFWMFSTVLGLNGLIGTAYAFHVEDIGVDVGMSKDVITALFIPAAGVAVATGFFVSWISDHCRLKYLLALQSLALAGFCLALIAPSLALTKAGIILGMGIANGCFGGLSSIVWARFYGRRYLGEVTGLFMMLIVWASAVGPLPFSIARDFSGHYAPAFVIGGVASLILTVLCFWADNPQRSKRV